MVEEILCAVRRYLQFPISCRVGVPVSGNLRANNGDALVAVELDEPFIELPGIYAVHPASRLPPARVRALIEFLAQRFGGTPPWDRP